MRPTCATASTTCWILPSGTGIVSICSTQQATSDPDQPIGAGLLHRLQGACAGAHTGSMPSSHRRSSDEGHAEWGAMKEQHR